MAQWFAFVVVPDCKAKSSKQGEGSVSNFVENLRERGTEGLWPHNGFSVYIVENPERNDTGWHFT
jgi:hypothetical protein